MFLLVAFAAALALALAPLLMPPSITPASAPAVVLSADRAMSHVRVIADEPHPMGSPQHDAAVAYLVDQLEVLGLEPQVQVTSVAAPAYDFAACWWPG